MQLSMNALPVGRPQQQQARVWHFQHRPRSSVGLRQDGHRLVSRAMIWALLVMSADRRAVSTAPTGAR